MFARDLYGPADALRGCLRRTVAADVQVRSRDRVTWRPRCCLGDAWRHQRDVTAGVRQRWVIVLGGRCIMGLQLGLVCVHCLDVIYCNDNLTSGQSNLTRPHRRRTWTVQSYSPRYFIKTYATGIWANAQPDGCPAERSWRPLFNAAKFGWRPLLDAVQ